MSNFADDLLAARVVRQTEDREKAQQIAQRLDPLTRLMEAIHEQHIVLANFRHELYFAPLSIQCGWKICSAPDEIGILLVTIKVHMTSIPAPYRCQYHWPNRIEFTPPADECRTIAEVSQWLAAYFVRHERNAPDVLPTESKQSKQDKNIEFSKHYGSARRRRALDIDEPITADDEVIPPGHDETEDSE